MEQDLRPTTTTDPHELPAGELVKQLSEQTRELVAQELALAKLELTEKAKRAGRGARHVRRGAGSSASTPSVR